MSDKNKSDQSGLVLENSLQGYFYDQLQKINKKVSSPLSNETIFYSSRVMDRLGSSKHYFDIEEGKVKDKFLGMKMMESSMLGTRQQKRILKDIGDTSLMVCGYFSESLNRKIIDTRYYKDIGQAAYHRLNKIVPQLLDVPLFYQRLAKSFEQITLIISLVSQKDRSHDDQMLLFVANDKMIKAS